MRQQQRRGLIDSMSQQHLYLAVQRLNLGNNNWNTLVTALQIKGERNNDNNPSLRNHWRQFLDGSIWIFEASFESTNIDVNWFINWLSSVFVIDPILIIDTTGYNIYGRFTTFDYLALSRFRIGVFGFVQNQGWPEYQESLSAVQQYLIDNVDDWEVAEILP